MAVGCGPIRENIKIQLDGKEGGVDNSCEASIMQTAFKSLGVFNWPK